MVKAKQEINIIEYQLDGLSIDLNKNILDFTCKQDAVSAFMQFIPLEEDESLVVFINGDTGYIFAGDATLRYKVD